ncbi:MAG: hypothetical protein MUF38_20540, partial [Anaerolineae bacterium]|nr:hypothetical protein [Anaerolineae bacterium]
MGQFQWLFPTHFFKAKQIFDNELTHDAIKSWFMENPKILLLDVGCGVGTATFAFIDCVVRIYENHKLDLPWIEIYSIGIDPDKYVLELFDTMARKIQKKLEKRSIPIKLTHEFIIDGLPGAAVPLIQHAKNILDKWEIPSIRRVLVNQLNVIRPFKSNFDERYGLKLPLVPKPTMGDIQSYSYSMIFNALNVDEVYLLSVST